MHIHPHPGLGNHGAGQRHRIAPGERVHALRSDMERNAQPPRHAGGRRAAVPRRSRNPRRIWRRDRSPRRYSAGPGERTGRAGRQVRLLPALRFRRGFFRARHGNPARSRARRSRTQASRMAARDFTGCMKWISAPGNKRRTSETSEIEAQSKCRTPPSHTARSTAGSGLHFTAYSTSPLNACTKARDEAAMTSGRMQCSGSSGRSDATVPATLGRRRRGIGAQREVAVQRAHRRRGFESGS